MKILSKSFSSLIYPFRKWMPMRAIMCLMMFTACWTSYTCRLQMPILIVPMMAETEEAESGGACNKVAEKVENMMQMRHHIFDMNLWSKSDDLLQDIAADGEVYRPGFSRAKRDHDDVDDTEERELLEYWSGRPFKWSSSIRGNLISAYAYGNVPGNLLGGIMAVKFGPRHTIMWTSLIAALLSLVSPILANIHWLILMASRVIIGLCGGVIFPACHTLVAKWAPPTEKARFVWSLLGGTFGTVFTYPMITAIAEDLNWEAAWYIPSILMIFWIFFWFVFAFDSPAEHPGISDDERDYIITSQAGTVRAIKPALKDTPIKAICTSVPFISLVVLHFGNIFLLFFYQTAMMIYLTKCLGFKLTKGGALASLPWLGRLVFGFFFSWVGDIIRKKEIVSLTTFRKCATIFSHFIPGVFLILVGYVGCNFVLANVYLFLALGFNGAASISNLTNNQDLSPNFAGFLYGIMNTFGTLTGIFTPLLVEEIAGKYGNPIEKWQIIFWIGGGVCIISMIVFLIGGSGQIQSWNEGKAKDGAGA